MKVLYDYQGLIQRIGGVSRYHCELIKVLPKVGIETIIPNIFSDNVYLDAIGVQHRHFLRGWDSTMRLNIYKYFNQKICLSTIRRDEYDIFHPTFVNPYYIGHTNNKPVIVTMHDLNHEKYPQFDTPVMKEKRKKVLDNCDYVIAISEQTKNDIIEYYGYNPDKISVVYHGIDQTIYTTNAIRIFEKPYILYVGSRESYKNFSTFIKAYSRLKVDVDLVCTGKPFNCEELAQIQSLGIQGRIHQIFASNEQMNQLMSQAIAFIYPSIGEGFGMPILEAYRCGCPCIISDIQCFHEVGGESVVYFDCNSPEAITYAIEDTITDSGKLKKLQKAGYERMKKFSWKKTAEDTAKIYKLFQK